MKRRQLLVLSASAILSACGNGPPVREPVLAVVKEEIVAVSVGNQLLRFNAGQPQKIRDRRPLQGLRGGERLLGIDYRVSRGELFALGASGQLYTIDVAQARAAAVGSGVVLTPGAPEWGFDFNPTVDRIRLVNGSGFNGRLHPDTGAIVDSDPAQTGVQFDGRLVYDAADRNAGKAPNIVAAGYTYNPTNDKITTNFALDGALGTLVHQGTTAGAMPAVSPNTGRLYTVGTLGIGSFTHASFDVSDLSDTAYAGVHAAGAKATRWYRIDLVTGKASFIGTVGGGEALVGAAIEP